MSLTDVTPSINEVWAKRLNDARLKAGLTQVELGERAGITYFTVNRIENRAVRANDDSKIAIAAALGVTVESLFPYPLPDGSWPK